MEIVIVRGGGYAIFAKHRLVLIRSDLYSEIRSERRYDICDCVDVVPPIKIASFRP